MYKLLNLSVSGLVTGAIYSIMASGLVLAYTTSGILNFAHGAVAFATAYLYYQLNTGLGVPIVPAFLLSVIVFAPLLGLVLDRILLRRLAKAPVYARVVGTIGLLVMLPAFVQWLFIEIGKGVLHLDLPGNEQTSQGVPVRGVGPNPPHTFRPFGSLVLTSDQLAVFVTALVTSAVLWYVLRRTRLGLEMRAVVDREQLAGLRGVNTARTSAIAWVMTMVLAGLGGVLIAPLFTLTDYMYTLVVLGALAVVVLGRLRSIPVAFVGGLLLGLVQNLMAGYKDAILPGFLADLSGMQSSIPYVLTIVLLLWNLRRDRGGRAAGVAAEDRPRPDHRDGLPAWRKRLPWAVFALVLVAYTSRWIPFASFKAGAFEQTIVAQGVAVAIIFLSFVVVTGMGGMVSMAQATFVTAGGFGAGWLMSRDWGIDIPLIASHGSINFFWAALFGALVAGAVGFVVALPMTRLGGVNIALGTLAAAILAALVVFPIDSIRNSQLGWTIRQPNVDIPVLNQIVDVLTPGESTTIDMSQLPVQVLVFLAVFGIASLSVHALMRSASGRAILAVRSSEAAAAAAGIRVQWVKVMTFSFSAAIAGLGGVMLGMFSFAMNDTSAPALIGLYWLALAVTFGVRRPAGALLAGLAYACSPAVFKSLAGVLPGETVGNLVTSPYFAPMLAGLASIQLAEEPDGALTLAGQRRLAKQREKAVTDSHAAEAAIGADLDALTTSFVMPVPPEPALSLTGIEAGYHGAQVLRGVDLHLERGKVLALIGANGAGKSTLCAVAAGLLAPSAGAVVIDGHDASSSEPHERARRGLLLIPEARGVFPGLSVRENIAVTLRGDEERARVLERFPILGSRSRQLAGLLSGGEQQILSLAPALADPPLVLIADEPTLGLAPLVAEKVMESVLEVAKRGSAVLLVEEHARNALKVADTIAVMELGRIVWCGPRAEADLDALSASYLGSNDDGARTGASTREPAATAAPA